MQIDGIAIGYLVIALLSAFGVGGAVGHLVRWKLGGKRTTEVHTFTEVTGTALSLVETLERQLNSARDTAERAQTEAEQARRENRELRADLDTTKIQYRGELDQLQAVHREEVNWATKARDALRARGEWPEGLAHTPPILLVVGQGQGRAP